MTDDRHLKDEAVWAYRCEVMRREIAWVHQQLVLVAFTDAAGDDSKPWALRIYDHLEAMEPRDLALIIALLLHREATEEARRLWSQLCTTRSPEDVPL